MTTTTPPSITLTRPILVVLGLEANDDAKVPHLLQQKEISG